MSQPSKPTEEQCLTVEQLINLLQKCLVDSIVQIWTEDHDFFVTFSALEFVENCSTSRTVRLLNYKPGLTSNDNLSIEIAQQEPHFAETKYYSPNGRPFLHY